MTKPSDIFNEISNIFDDEYDDVTNDRKLSGYAEITEKLSATIFVNHLEIVNEYIDIAHAFAYDCIDNSIASSVATAMLSSGMTGPDSILDYSGNDETIEMIIDMVLNMTGVNQVIEMIDTLKRTYIDSVINPMFNLISMFFTSSSICTPKDQIDSYRAVIYSYMRDLEMYHYLHIRKTNTPPSSDEIDESHDMIYDPIPADDMQAIEKNAIEKTNMIIDETNGFQFKGILEFLNTILNCSISDIVHYVLINSIGGIFTKILSTIFGIMMKVMSLFCPKMFKWLGWYVGEHFNHRIGYDIINGEAPYVSDDFAILEEADLLTMKRTNGMIDNAANFKTGKKTINATLENIRDRCYSLCKARLHDGIDESFDAISLPLTIFVLEAVFNKTLMMDFSKEMIRKTGNSIACQFTGIDMSKLENTTINRDLIINGDAQQSFAVKDALENSDFIISYSILHQSGLDMLCASFIEPYSLSEFKYEVPPCDTLSANVIAYEKEFGTSVVSGDMLNEVLAAIDSAKKLKIKFAPFPYQNIKNGENEKYLSGLLAKMVPEESNIKKKTIKDVASIMTACQTNMVFTTAGIIDVMKELVMRSTYCMMFLSVELLKKLLDKFNIELTPPLNLIKQGLSTNMNAANLKELMMCMLYSFETSFREIFMAMMMSIFEPVITKTIEKFLIIAKKAIKMNFDIQLASYLYSRLNSRISKHENAIYNSFIENYMNAQYKYYGGDEGYYADSKFKELLALDAKLGLKAMIEEKEVLIENYLFDIENIVDKLNKIKNDENASTINEQISSSRKAIDDASKIIANAYKIYSESTDFKKLVIDKTYEKEIDAELAKIDEKALSNAVIEISVLYSELTANDKK